MIKPLIYSLSQNHSDVNQIYQKKGNAPALSPAIIPCQTRIPKSGRRSILERNLPQATNSLKNRKTNRQKPVGPFLFGFSANLRPSKHLPKRETIDALKLRRTPHCQTPQSGPLKLKDFPNSYHVAWSSDSSSPDSKTLPVSGDRQGGYVDGCDDASRRIRGVGSQENDSNYWRL
jgi:hypothetical protein